jgi:MFS transporter, MHS family, proline/betaine transporter
LTRPLGGLIFGHIGDRFGRRQLITLSVVMMAVPTFLTGMLPTYASVGILAPVLLTGLRLIQGISAGGEFSGSIILLVEHAPPNQRGLYGSIANFGAMIGALLGAGMGWLLTAFLPADVTYDWGWRIPFLTSIIIGALGLWIRLESPIRRPIPGSKTAGH